VSRHRDTKESSRGIWVGAGVVLLALVAFKSATDTSERTPQPEPLPAGGSGCVSKGIAYYKEIGSYPTLSDGRDAQTVVLEKCANSPIAFG
jgi:hypothetical protein